MSLAIYEGLTEKQLEFCLAIASGMPMAMSYRKAYNTENMSDSSVNAAASLLMDHPKVSAFITRSLDDRISKSIAVNTKWVRQFIIDRSMMEAMDEHNPGNVRLKALEVLGKATGAMSETVIVEHTRKPDIIEEEIREKLKGMLSAMGETIDVTPSPPQSSSATK